LPFQVLHIDDDPLSIDLVKTVLSGDPDIEVISRMNAADALASLSQVDPDLIITDLMMPEMGGLELTNALRNDTAAAGVPIIILSSRSKQIRDYAKDLENVPMMLDKPVDPKALREKVRSLLDGATAQ
jgi:CheY-like chemotaxis protein